MKTIFVDSNLFLQCKDLKALAWADLYGEEKLLLLVPRAVQKEIDNFKGQGNTRRSKRAKAASTFFREILKIPEAYAITPLVQIGFPLRRELALVPPEPSLSADRNDDLIIQDILSYQSIHSEEVVELLTHDTGLMVSAREYGVTYTAIPDDWLLAREPDDRDKKIQELAGRLAALEESYPKIDIELTETAGCPVEKLNFTYIEYPELTESELEQLLQEVFRKHPLETDFGAKPRTTTLNLDLSALHIGYTPPKESEIKHYSNEAYPAWKESIEKALRELPPKLTAYHNVFASSLTIANNGQLPAESVLVEITLSNNLYLYLPPSNEEGEEDRWKLPRPPIAPQGRSLSSLASLASSVQAFPRFDDSLLKAISPLRPRDKNTFYWKDGKPSSLTSKWERICEEFRHQMHPVNYSIGIVPHIKARPTRGVIKCTVSARNIPNPIRQSTPIEVIYETGHTYDKVRELLLDTKLI